MRVGEDRLMRIVNAPRRRGRCRDCRQPVEWAVTVPNGRDVPLDPNPLVLRYERTGLGVRILVISVGARHLATCRRRRERHPVEAIFSGARR